jgi:hypothetical protein
VAELVDRLFDDYASRRARGERPDPRDYLARAGDGAEELGEMIDRLLMAAPAQPADPELVAMMEAWVEDEPPLLGLRRHRGVRVDQVVEVLLERLGIDPAGRAKVRRCYQRLEAGLAEPRRVDRRVVAAIAAALGVPERDVAIGGPPAPSAARSALARSDGAQEGLLAPIPSDAAEPDEIDRLFGLA